MRRDMIKFNHVGRAIDFVQFNCSFVPYQKGQD